MVTYAISHRSDGRNSLYTYGKHLAETVMFTLGADRLEAVSSEPVGEEMLYAITYPRDAHDELEAVMVTRGAVEVEVLDIPSSVLASLDETQADELEASMRRHPANGTHPIGELVTMYELEACRTCRTNTRLSLTASLAGLAASLIALVAVLVALQ